MADCSAANGVSVETRQLNSVSVPFINYFDGDAMMTSFWRHFGVILESFQRIWVIDCSAANGKSVASRQLK